MPKRCKDCHISYPDDFIYCPECGAKLIDDLFGSLFTEVDEDFFTVFSKTGDE